MNNFFGPFLEHLAGFYENPATCEPKVVVSVQRMLKEGAVPLTKLLCSRQ